MKYISMLRWLISYLLPGANDKTWGEVARETVQLFVRLLAFVIMYAILCHAIRTGVADWVKALLVSVAVYGKT